MWVWEFNPSGPARTWKSPRLCWMTRCISALDCEQRWTLWWGWGTPGRVRGGGWRRVKETDRRHCGTVSSEKHGI